MNNPIVIALLAFAVWKIFRKKSPPGSQTAEVNTANLTFQENDYLVFADQIEAAIYGSFLGMWEDDEAITEVLKIMQTKDDVLQLIKAYGVRGTYLEERNLVAAVQTYLDSAKKAEVNQDYQAKGIELNWL